MPHLARIRKRRPHSCCKTPCRKRAYPQPNRSRLPVCACSGFDRTKQNCVHKAPKKSEASPRQHAYISCTKWRALRQAGMHRQLPSALPFPPVGKSAMYAVRHKGCHKHAGSPATEAGSRPTNYCALCQWGTSYQPARSDKHIRRTRTGRMPVPPRPHSADAPSPQQILFTSLRRGPSCTTALQPSL